jgi:hypothetical protein
LSKNTCRKRALQLQGTELIHGFPQRFRLRQPETAPTKLFCLQTKFLNNFNKNVQK